MNEELIDVINERNQVIGQEFKSLCHQQGLLHRVIISEVIDSKARWILVKQASDRQDAGQYVSPVGGHIRSGETEVDALKREAMEELSLHSFTSKRVGTAIFNRFVIGRQENHMFILYEIHSDQKPKLNHESESYKRFTTSQLKQQLKDHPELFGDAYHFVVKTFYSHLLI
jgi:isopentenyl-diphosphate delta-isomerase